MLIECLSIQRYGTISLEWSCNCHVMQVTQLTFPIIIIGKNFHDKRNAGFGGNPVLTHCFL